MPQNVTVWFLPGFMGSSLYLPLANAQGQRTGRRLKLWLDVRGILTGLTYQHLVYPDQTVLPIEVGEVLTEGYGNFLVTWQNRRALPKGWKLKLWPFDWRRPIRDLGKALADEVIAAGGEVGSHMLVGHSQGGAVAVASWPYLVAAQKQGQIGRILTLSGILYGSYSTARTWAEYEDTQNLFAIIPQATRLVLFGGRFGPIPDSATLYRTIAEVFVTWPATYDMPPDPARGDDFGDVSRGLTFDPAAWENALVQPRWDLWETSRTTYHQWIHRPENQPPKSVLMHVCAQGQRSASRIHPSALPGQAALLGNRPLTWEQRKAVRQASLPQFEISQEGDNRATLPQQRLPEYAAIIINGEHAEVQNSPAFVDNLFSWLAAPIPGVVDPPPQIPLPRDFPETFVPRRQIASQTAIGDLPREEGQSVGEPGEGGPFVQRVYSPRQR